VAVRYRSRLVSWCLWCVGRTVPTTGAVAEGDWPGCLLRFLLTPRRGTRRCAPAPHPRQSPERSASGLAAAARSAFLAVQKRPGLSWHGRALCVSRGLCGRKDRTYGGCASTAGERERNAAGSPAPPAGRGLSGNVGFGFCCLLLPVPNLRGGPHVRLRRFLAPFLRERAPKGYWAYDSKNTRTSFHPTPRKEGVTARRIGLTAGPGAPRTKE
jgi:hypothetical protein